ncbi:S-adenosyl-L-methionine-dependent methyltransferase [Dichomitus squalens LYAD-421 SS1]|uniref:S-adenosyl-L-methionine-dependent methyltransferase n=1 Tax=Dichomitus squalens (strain LYAD-421) TaxID=732165 RepID=UPI0004414732|nr:S-adenosyl-L-methionine-dependent methyltransferase [Dichomitus squalens LYAD-421 SS1]EJF65151.1 S-adenosyl-L-methionine-dependent methyltransferase [Dichomitus squalens LYAD-421 SS1]
MLSLRLHRLCARSRLQSLARTYSSQSLLPPLPPQEEWRKTFTYQTVARRDRVFVRTPQAARSIAQSLFTRTPAATDKGKVVIEAFPGPGALSRALLELPSSTVRKLIILEDDPTYLKYLEPLADADPRVTVVPMSGHKWDTYSHLDEHGLLDDVEACPWDATIPDLHFVSHLAHNVYGEQLVAQLFRSIPERAWLFKYGRVPMSIIMSEWVWSRLTAGPGTSRRCKLSVIAEATADIQDAFDPALVSPYEAHFYPPPAVYKKGLSRKPGQPMYGITAVPYVDQVIQKGMTDQWDYVLRRLFVLKSTVLKDAISSLAPGAVTLLKVLGDASLPRDQRVNVSKRIRELNVADWALIHRAFDAWPFKPQDLLIGDAFMPEE